MNATKIETFFATLQAANPHPQTELEFSSVFELMAAVLLSAQATDVGVNKATRKLFVVANTPQKILALGLDGLEAYIKTIGLYRSKARHLMQTCQMLVDLHGGQVPRTREALQALPGVGRKTANVVLNVAFGEPTMAVDTHIFRVGNRTGLAPGKTVSDGIKEMERIKKLLLDESFSTALSGSSRDFAESSSNTSFAFILALMLIFLILAAQFESFIDPFIIMFTVPLAIAGAVLSLWIFGQTLNIFSQIGMIMLIGLVTKNGILIVEFANKNRLQGMKKAEAVIFAASQRLRPILMTSLAMSLGALPLALSLGDAATSRIPLGIVIVGGILFSLILTLFVIAAMYIFLSSKKKKSELDNPENTTLSV